MAIPEQEPTRIEVDFVLLWVLLAFVGLPVALLTSLVLVPIGLGVCSGLLSGLILAPQQINCGVACRRIVALVSILSFPFLSLRYSPEIAILIYLGMVWHVAFLLLLRQVLGIYFGHYSQPQRKLTIRGMMLFTASVGALLGINNAAMWVLQPMRMTVLLVPLILALGGSALRLLVPIMIKMRSSPWSIPIAQVGFGVVLLLLGRLGQEVVVIGSALPLFFCLPTTLTIAAWTSAERQRVRQQAEINESTNAAANAPENPSPFDEDSNHAVTGEDCGTVE